MAVLVYRQVTDDEYRVLALRRRAGAAEQSPQPRDDLLEAERLGHVVVAAGSQTRDAVLDGVLGGQEQNRDMRLPRADSAQDLDTAEVGQHDVEQDHVGIKRTRGANGGVPRQGGLHLPALVPQHGREQLPEARLVIDDKGPNRRTVRAGGGGGAASRN